MSAVRVTPRSLATELPAIEELAPAAIGAPVPAEELRLRAPAEAAIERRPVPIVARPEAPGVEPSFAALAERAARGVRNARAPAPPSIAPAVAAVDAMLHAAGDLLRLAGAVESARRGRSAG